MEYIYQQSTQYMTGEETDDRELDENGEPVEPDEDEGDFDERI